METAYDHLPPPCRPADQLFERQTREVITRVQPRG